MRRRLLPCVSPKVAHRDILRRRASLVAFGSEVEIDRQLSVSEGDAYNSNC
jgi:hypothetical protein